MGFFFIIAVWTIVWLGWNTLAPSNVRFDPAPAFVLWLFISNLIQIHLMPPDHGRPEPAGAAFGASR